MRYLPILDELFASDSVIFLLIGLVIAIVIGSALKSDKRRMGGGIASIIIYAVCEVVSNIPAPFLVSMIALFIGTIAIGSFIGFWVTFVVSKIRGKRI